MPSVLPALVASIALAQVAPVPPGAMEASVTQGNLRIHDVATSGSGEELRALLKADPKLVDARNVRKVTPLLFAAINPDLTALDALLAAGADVNAKDEDGTTALHMAAFSRKAEHARVLLEAGADTEAKTVGGRTPRMMAEKARADEVAGVISLWILKGCKPGQHCGVGAPRDVKKLVK